MRYFLLAIILIFTWSTTTIHAAETDKISIIIEVDGDPEQHVTYLKVYHPFIEVVAVYDQLFNGLALRAKPEQFEGIGSLEFIKAIHPVREYEALSSELPITENSVIPSALNDTKFTGKGVKVGVIDTGIDYYHPDLVKNYQGGYDLVDLDDDPMETTIDEADKGPPTLHGTHVAGIIAANGALKGVAEDAEIYAYRALGPGGMGTSIQVIAALEEAIKDNVDVINLSLGNSINGPDYPTSIAVNGAVEKGIAVVIANGNEGPDDWTVGSPATASKALAVGASAPAQYQPFLVEKLAGKSIPLAMMHGSVSWKFDKKHPIIHMTDEDVNVRGKIALIKRSDTPFYVHAKEAEDAGAVAVIIYNNEEDYFQGSIVNEEYPLEIPVAAIAKADGDWINTYIDSNSTFLETVYQRIESKPADFSSRGPVTVNWDIKPDVLAPGTSILSTVPGGYLELQGTSMAAPHVAGVIALMKEARPDWTNKQIVGALRTTALQMVDEDGVAIDPIIQGMGNVQPEQAIHAKTIIDDPLLAFGRVTDDEQTKITEINIENKTDESQTYAFDMPRQEKGLRWKLPQSFTIEAGEARKVSIELNVSRNLLEEGIEQGWLTLKEQEETYHLPYVFINQTADYPKAMGFDFSLKAFSMDTYAYQLYMAEPAKSVEVHLYNPDTLLYEDTLLELTDVSVGMNEGDINRRTIKQRGLYKALVTVKLGNGVYESHETEVYVE